MITKLTVAINRKVGRANYSSDGASCSFEVSLDEGELTKPSQLQAKIRSLFDYCDQAVQEQLERTEPVAAAINGHAATGAPPVQQQCPPPSGQPPATAQTGPPAGNSNSRGPVKTGRELAGWLKGEGSSHKSQAYKLCKQWNVKTYWIEMPDATAVWLYNSLLAVEPSANGQH
jgi:hypothetical protein